MSEPASPTESDRSAPVAPGTPINAPTSAEIAKYAATRSELNSARSRIQDLEAELADFSSQVMQEANKQVGDANRNVASYKKKNTALENQISERDILIESQKVQLDVLKQMISEMDTKSSTKEAKKAININVESDIALERALEYAIWSPPTEPLYRYDTYEYEQFLRIKVPVDDEQWFKKTLTSWKFAATTIEHEVEPLLNISNAAHMSWLARRAFGAAVQDGTLEIKPITSSSLPWATRPSCPCCFCGRNSSHPQYARLHSISIPKDQQEYLVGNECVIRVRFACDYLAFLRSLFTGLRKLDTKEAQHAAWAECTRLRQQLFWARVGGFWALAQTESNRNNYVTLEALGGDDAEFEDTQDTVRADSPSEGDAPTGGSEKVGHYPQDGATTPVPSP